MNNFSVSKIWNLYQFFTSFKIAVYFAIITISYKKAAGSIPAAPTIKSEYYQYDITLPMP